MKELRPIGELLLARGLIDKDQLAFALQEQKACRSRGDPSNKTQLGNILCSLAFLSQADLALALADLGGSAIAPVDLPAQVCQALKVVPLGVADRTLTVTALRPLSDSETSLILGAARHSGVDVTKVAVQVTHNTSTLLAELSTLTVDPSQVDSMVERLDKDPEGGVVTELLRAIQHDAVQQRASDAYLNVSARTAVLTYRVDGKLMHRAHMSTAAATVLLTLIKREASMELGMRYAPQDGSVAFMYHGREVGMRVATQPVLGGETVTMRVQDPALLRGIGHTFGVHTPIAHELKALAAGDVNGLLLISGATGSGKTTTLYSLLRDFPRATKRCITAEDPVEQKIREVQQTQVNEHNGLGFAQIVRSAMRQSPDFLVVGETRDPPTADAVLAAAETGHPVATTVHAGSAFQTLVRFVSLLSPESRQAGLTTLAMTLQGIVNQRLTPRLCSCSTKVAIGPNSLGLPPETEGKEGAGCDICRGTGYQGRVLVPEGMFFTPASRDGLLETLRSGMAPVRLANLDGVKYYRLQDAVTALVVAGEIAVKDGMRLANEGRS